MAGFHTDSCSQMHHTLVFHDLSCSPLSILIQLIKLSKSSSVVQDVLQTCARAIRTERALLAKHERDTIPRFETFNDLIRQLDGRTVDNLIMSTALSVVTQLGCFALLAERKPLILNAEQKGIKCIGVCTGVLVAAAAASARTLRDIVDLAYLITRIAFRFGVESDRRSRAIDPNPSSWAFVPRGVSLKEAEKILEEFHESRQILNHQRAYISAELPDSVTISGPPATMNLLKSFDHPQLKTQKTMLPIKGAFHAAHLPCPDVDHILDINDLSSFSIRPNVDFISVQGSMLSSPTDLRSTLRHVITACFQSRMVLSAVNNPHRNVPPNSTQIISIEPAGSLKSIRAWLDKDRVMDHIIAGVQPANKARTMKNQNQIAVIGMAGRFPKADTLEEFWDIVLSGKDVHQAIPEGRFDAQKSYDETAAGKNTTASPYGCFMKRPGMFDNVFFNLSPREAKQIDPQQRILLMVTQEALQMAGYSNTDNKRVGTFFGQATDDWRESHTRQNIDIFYVGAGMRAFAPGRLNYHYKWEGPSYSVDTACSSSLAALELACKAVQRGECDIAVAGGGNLCSALPMFSGLSKGKFTSSTGSCKTFCVTADGYCRGEAVGVVVIQRVEDAIYDKSNIRGVIAGIATNHSAKASSITHPHAATQQALMLHTLDIAGLEPADVDYVEFHGTGTQAGDVAEMTSVSSVFDQGGTRSTPLHVGAVKANVGHGEAAAGITSLIKALLMLQHNTIPPHCGIKVEMNAKVKSRMSPDLRVTNIATEFKPKDGPKNILINNFNATGGNTSMILQQSLHTYSRHKVDPRSHFPIVFSAKTSTSLKENLSRLLKFLEGESTIELSDISWSSTARRMHHSIREAFTSSSLSDLMMQIRNRLPSVYSLSSKPVPQIGFAFAGQGTQTQGIAAELYETSSTFRSILNKYENICTCMGYPPFVEFLTNEDRKERWSAVQLQLATVAIELGLAKLWQRWGIEPSFVIGHSIGEYPALCFAGVISTTDMFSLVGRRAELLETHCEPGTHAMLSAQASSDTINDMKSANSLSACEVSCYNSHQATTISGPKASLEKFQKYLSEKNVRSKFLDVSYAFHSAQIDPILDEYHNYASSVCFSKPKIPVLSTLLGKRVTEVGVFSAQYLARQARQPVNFIGAVENSLVDGADNTIWIEVGPGDPSCLPIFRSGLPANHRIELLPSLSTRSKSWNNISEVVSSCYKHGISVDWPSYHREFESSLFLLDMPQYAFDLQDFWIPLEPEADAQVALQPVERVSPLLHTVQNFSNNQKGAIAQFKSSLCDAYLFDLISGHLVLGTPLCPSSVYCAIAMEASSYLRDKVLPNHELDLVIELDNMEIQRPLIVTRGTNLELQVCASNKTRTGSTSVTFASFGKDKSSTTHGSCSVRNADLNVWKSDWSKLEFLINARIESVESSKADKILRLPRSVIYKLFSHIVKYDEPFQGIQQITLDNENSEATADVRFNAPSDTDDKFDVHLIDVFLHFAGFVLNNGIDDDEHAFISDGWDSMRIPSRLKRTDTYKFYVRLSADQSGQTFSGDVYAMKDKTVVACCNGVRFKKMRRYSLQSILSQKGSQKSLAAKTMSRETNPSQNRHSNRVSASTVLSQKSSDDPLTTLKRIVAEESHVAIDKITENTSVQELGLDSILMMSVLDKIKQQTGIEVPTQEAADASTFGNLKHVLMSRLEPRITSNRQSEEESSDGNSNSTSDSEPWSPVDEAQESLEVLDIIIDIIAKQTGVSRKQVEQASEFSTLGVDSLLCLDIMDAVHRQTSLQLPSELLQEHPNVESLRGALPRKSSHVDVRGRASPGSNASTLVSESNSPQRGASPQGVKLALNHLVKTKSTSYATLPPESEDSKFLGFKIRLIQGNSRSECKPLFFMPPGDGTAGVYAKLPKHTDNIPIYTIESPYANDPDNHQNTFVSVAQGFKAAVRKISPSGPYHIAGYSVGGAYAYEVTRLLLEENCTVATLIIIDCPAPSPPLADGLSFGLDAVRMVGYDNYLLSCWPTMPLVRFKHTAAAAREFNRYDPKPFRENRPGHITVIWSEQGDQDTFIRRCIDEQRLLDQTPFHRKARIIEERRQQADWSWCFKKRTDFGPQGWDQWLGSDVVYEVVDGDHHSVMIAPHIAQTAAKAYEALRIGMSKQMPN